MSVAENSKFIALVADNGTEFVSEQKAVFTIQPDIGFIKGRDSYLSFDMLNTDSNSRVNVLQGTAGASAVIDRLDIFSLANGQLLESLTNYNLWSSIENQYCKEDDAHSMAKEGTAPNLRSYTAESNPTSKLNTLVRENEGEEARSTQNLNAMNISVISGGSQVGANPYTATDDSDPEMGAKKFTARKFCIPLRSGIFSHFGVAEKLTPILLFGGLRIEFTFARNERVLQRINVSDSDTTNVQAASYATGIAVQDLGADTTIEITADISNPEELGITRGCNMIAQGSTGATQAFSVSHIHRGDSGAGVPSNKIIIIKTGGNFTPEANAPVRIYFTPSEPTYKLKNVEMKVLQVVPPKQLMKSIIKESQFDYISWDCFLDNIPQSSLSHQSEITSVASAGKCIMSHYIGVAKENDVYASSYYCGEPPHNTFLNSVQYFINNKLYPLKPYNPQAKNDKVVNLNEVIKSFQTIGLEVKRLGDGRAGNLTDYTNSYLHARELARGDQFVYNLKDAEPQIRLTFSGERSVAPNGGTAVGNCRVIHFVWSVKTIMVNKDNLQLIL
jgi:hypothetical protein